MKLVVVLWLLCILIGFTFPALKYVVIFIACFGTFFCLSCKALVRQASRPPAIPNPRVRGRAIAYEPTSHSVASFLISWLDNAFFSLLLSLAVFVISQRLSYAIVIFFSYGLARILFRSLNVTRNIKCIELSQDPPHLEPPAPIDEASTHAMLSKPKTSFPSKGPSITPLKTDDDSGLVAAFNAVQSEGVDAPIEASKAFDALKTTPIHAAEATSDEFHQKPVLPKADDNMFRTEDPSASIDPSIIESGATIVLEPSTLSSSNSEDCMVSSCPLASFSDPRVAFVGPPDGPLSEAQNCYPTLATPDDTFIDDDESRSNAGSSALASELETPNMSFFQSLTPCETANALHPGAIKGERNKRSLLPGPINQVEVPPTFSCAIPIRTQSPSIAITPSPIPVDDEYSDDTLLTEPSSKEPPLLFSVPLVRGNSSPYCPDEQQVYRVPATFVHAEDPFTLKNDENSEHRDSDPEGPSDEISRDEQFVYNGNSNAVQPSTALQAGLLPQMILPDLGTMPEPEDVLLKRIAANVPNEAAAMTPETEIASETEIAAETEIASETDNVLETDLDAEIQDTSDQVPDVIVMPVTRYHEASSGMPFYADFVSNSGVKDLMAKLTALDDQLDQYQGPLESYTLHLVALTRAILGMKYGTVAVCAILMLVPLCFTISFYGTQSSAMLPEPTCLLDHEYFTARTILEPTSFLQSLDASNDLKFSNIHGSPFSLKSIYEASTSMNINALSSIEQLRLNIIDFYSALGRHPNAHKFCQMTLQGHWQELRTIRSKESDPLIFSCLWQTCCHNSITFSGSYVPPQAAYTGNLPLTSQASLRLPRDIFSVTSERSEDWILWFIKYSDRQTLLDSLDLDLIMRSLCIDGVTWTFCTPTSIDHTTTTTITITTTTRSIQAMLFDKIFLQDVMPTDGVPLAVLFDHHPTHP